MNCKRVMQAALIYVVLFSILLAETASGPRMGQQCIAPASTHLHADLGTLPLSVSGFSIPLLGYPVNFTGIYYGVSESNALVIFVPGGDYVDRRSYGWLNTWAPSSNEQLFIKRLNDFGFDVAVFKHAWFPAVTTGEGLDQIMHELENEYGSHECIVLIGHSGGGAVVGNYITTHPNSKVAEAVILDAPLTWVLEKNQDVAHQLTASAFSAMNLTTPTMLIYGTRDTTVPYTKHANVWMQNAPQGLTTLKLFDYAHSPWEDPTPQSTREQVEETIIQSL